MSEAATTRETDSQEGDKKQQACTGPLKPVPPVEGQEFIDLVTNRGFGKAKPKEGKEGLGLGIYDKPEDGKAEDDKKFPSAAVEAIYTDDNLRYEECTTNRIKSDQKDGDKITMHEKNIIFLFSFKLYFNSKHL